MGMNPFNRFTHKAQEVLQRAQEIAMEKNQLEISSLHVLFAMLWQDESVIAGTLEKLGVDIEKFSALLEQKINAAPKIFTLGQPSPFGQFYISQELVQALQKAGEVMTRLKDEYVTPETLFIAIANMKTRARDALEQAGIAIADIEKTVLELRGSDRVTEEGGETKRKVLEKYTTNLTELAKRKKLDPVIGRERELRRVMEVLSRRTKNNPILIGEPGVGKTAIVEGLAQMIVAGEVPEPLKHKELLSLDIGSMVAGTKFRGEFEDRLKTALKEISAGEGKYILFIDEVHVIVGAGAAEGAIDASNLLKPALARGELHAIGATTLKEYQKYIERDPALERRFQPILVEEPSRDDAIAILRGLKEKYEIHHGVRITDAALVAAVDLSIRYITDRCLPDKAIDLMDEAGSSLRLEIESIPQEIDEVRRGMRRLEIEKEALKKESDAQSQKRSRQIEHELKNIVKKNAELSAQWEKEKQAVGKVHEIRSKIEQLRQESEQAESKGDLTRVAEIIYGLLPQAQKDLATQEKREESMRKRAKFVKEAVTEEEVGRVVSRWIGVPVSRILQSEAEKFANLEKILSSRVVGQGEAISAISRALRRSRAGLGEVDQPIGSFIFLGPTGVGKTYLVRNIAEVIFGDEKNLVRLDMSEYMEKYTVARLIGSPPGYVAHEEGGQLTEIVKHKPYSVILFDEIEKAHPDVFNILLQILDNGRLTDGKGKVVNFKNTIVVMTSNVGGEYLKKMASFGFATFDEGHYRDEKNKIMETLRSHFRPEFLNRIDEIVIFNPLTKRDIERIVQLQLEKVIERLRTRNITLEITDSAKRALAQRGYDPEFGARPLKRLIQREVLDPLSERIMQGTLKPNKKVVVSAKGEAIEIKA